jgi:hypothetical protein
MNNSRVPVPKLLDSRTIPCPSCLAPVGRKCYGSQDYDHYGRHKLAVELQSRIESKMSDAR